jgi:uncharacterized protein
MIQPHELKTELPVKLANGKLSTTAKVWRMLVVAREGDLNSVRILTEECPGLVYAQYNYTPPVHLAVREGHSALVKFLLDRGAYDPLYKIYPFGESLQTIARDRGYEEIAQMLEDYAETPSRQQHKGDNGEILYDRTEVGQRFQEVVNKNDLAATEQILQQHPELALDHSYFWGEGILTFAAKGNHREMIDLLTGYGATVPPLLKWGQFYYFERLDGATYMMQKGMDPNTKSWHHVTLLHDMAQKGYLEKAALLLEYGANMNTVDEEYLSTPLGMAARWGQTEMVDFLLQHGADPNLSGASWSTPLAWSRKKGYPQIESLLIKGGALK